MVLFEVSPVMENYLDKRGNFRMRLRTAFLCVCTCGNLKTIKAYCLLKGEYKSCGECLFNNPSLSSAKRLFKERYNDGNLTFEEFYKLSQMNCFYCNRAPEQVYNGYIFKKKKVSQFAKINGDFIYNGLDRVDNNKGHDLNNLVPCCKVCNYGKRDMSSQDFKQWIVSIYNHWGNK